MDAVTTAETPLEEKVANAREFIEGIGARVWKMKTDPKFINRELPDKDASEAIANIMLAYRHLEDARMRLGKVFQAMNGGVSNSER